MDHDQLNVLVIDDDPATLELFTEIICRVEHQVVTAISAEEGLKLLPFWTFQVAFIDQRLPGMEGLVLGEYLRKNNPDMTLALVTGDDDRSLQRKSRDLRMVFIQKPFEVSEILQVLDDFMDGAKERRESRLRKQDSAYGAQFAVYGEEIAASYDMPKVPTRIHDRLVETLKRSLNNLRSVGRYTERDRAMALAGLLCAKVLDAHLPRSSSERTLYEEYDEMMRQHGRRTEFGDG